MKVNGLVLILFTLFCSAALNAQVIEDDSTEVRYVLVELNNGQEYIGSVIEQNNQHIILRLENGGTFTIPMDQVASIQYVKYGSTDGYDVFYHNLQATRYFFGPNGFGLKQGEGYYQNTWIFINQVSVGVTDFFTIGGGVVPLFLFAGAPTPVWITPKFSVPIKEDLLNVGVGGLFGGVLGVEESFFGIGYGAVTFGNRDHNLNLSVGYGMSNGEWSSDPTITVSGMTRVGRKLYLISENYFLPNFEVAFLSFGGRSLFTNLSMDYGLVFPLETGVFIGIPWLGITVPFKPKN